jgi:hypothetical protein
MFRILGIIAGAISATILLSSGLHLPFEPFIAQLLQLYEAGMARAFGLVEPPIVEVLAWLKIQFGWHLDLHPHWKHLFVLAWLYFWSVAKAHLSERSDYVDARFPRRALLRGIWIQGPQGELALVRMSWGLLVAFLSAVTAGTIDLNGTNAIWLIPACALAGYTLQFVGIDAYLAIHGPPSLGDTWAARFWNLFRSVPLRIVTGLTVIGLCTRAGGFPFLRPPDGGLVVLFALVALQVLWRLCRGVWSGSPGQAASRGRRLGRSKVVPPLATNFALSPRREWRVETIYFDRGQRAEPLTAIAHRMGGLKNMQIGSLLPGAVIVLGIFSLVLFSRLFW